VIVTRIPSDYRRGFAPAYRHACEPYVSTHDRGGHCFHVGKEFAQHETVNHGDDEYVRGDAHTNTAEGRFSLMKRAVYGMHHSVSEAHPTRYLAEWHFKWNTSKISDGERAALTATSAQDERLT
jgi:ISXO2-like transposase domain